MVKYVGVHQYHLYSHFVMLPLWLMGIVEVAVVFELYQFVTADLQPFSYFQF